jgi:predicted GNAT family N-acyltransferase
VEEERDSHDDIAIHVVAVVEGDVVGTLRLIRLPEHLKIGRVAVRADVRGRGIATRMMTFAMQLGRAGGETRFYLAAQTDKIGLYERFGFVAYGDEFEDGGMPHRSMRNY